MSRLLLGSLLGLCAGAVSVATMIPMSFPDKRAAMLGAFCGRFLIGFFAGTSTLPMNQVLAGLLIGLLTSLPDAIITKAYAPILIMGVIYGALIGWALKLWG